MFSNDKRGEDDIKKIKGQFPKFCKKKSLDEQIIKVRIQKKLGNIFVHILEVLKNLYTLQKQTGKAFSESPHCLLIALKTD